MFNHWHCWVWILTRCFPSLWDAWIHSSNSIQGKKSQAAVFSQRLRSISGTHSKKAPWQTTLNMEGRATGFYAFRAIFTFKWSDNWRQTRKQAKATDVACYFLYHLGMLFINTAPSSGRYQQKLYYDRLASVYLNIPVAKELLLLQDCIYAKPSITLSVRTKILFAEKPPTSQIKPV